MRVDPAKRIRERLELSPEERKAIQQAKINHATRVIAIVLAFISTFIFFFKILYF
ncbi:hypothetical protein HDF19_16280 [Mucilaginibacter sp. E4BP6]|jgi:preprotein translocase subunit SecY|uniref:hypothetical protein n=1 Tax=Mucilaginibacter sp. E4BP6 TaxID=2723089 RepID=UPI0015CAFDAB|nr:hypothetical protein [Mucilaginibacter sp. E4BP6]NYE66556.1 preprotein translocase subunit SecY [Mucilaginibacter sp. E4BP6]